ncbi:hypothetical protein [Pseudonocardia sp.]|uniref:hypothetical protein n=1 Tax=Pseudonocardia sp. TaxID=60912 RepID=UPI003D0CB21D
MTEVGAVADVVDAIAQASVEGADQLLRETALCPPPTLHILSRHLASPYIGSVSTRPFFRGKDACDAVATLGLLPSLLCATQLVVVWENADLCTAVDPPADVGYASAVVVLDATMNDHVLRWHSFEPHLGEVTFDGMQTIRPEWRSPAQFPGAPLPAPVLELLTLWREWRVGDVQAAITELESAGYRTSWVQRP